MTDDNNEQPMPPPDPPDDDAPAEAAIEIHLSNVRLVQHRLGNAIVELATMPVAEGDPRLLHVEVLMALANIYCGTATDWLSRSPKDEFALARDRALGMLGNMSAVICSIVDPNDETKQKVH